MPHFTWKDGRASSQLKAEVSKQGLTHRVAE